VLTYEIVFFMRSRTTFWQLWSILTSFVEPKD
jgi:hypothetical protein